MLRTSGVMSLKTLQKSSTVLQGRHLGAGAFPPQFLSRRKVIEKEHFGVILRILLVKPKHLPPPRRKNVYSSNHEKKILHDFPVFCNGGLCEKGENFKFMWSWT